MTRQARPWQGRRRTLHRPRHKSARRKPQSRWLKPILNYTVIRSPIDGTVVARNVDVGQTVAASLQAPTIFTIAQDLSKMWVYAKTDESDVGNIKIGKARNVQSGRLPQGHVSRGCEPGPNECDHRAKRGYL